MPLAPSKVDKVTSVPLKKDQLKNTFMMFDADGNKVLSRDEIKKAFDHLGSMIPGFRANRDIRYADKNNDGTVDMSELDDLVKYAVKIGFSVKQEKFYYDLGPNYNVTQ